MQIHSTAIVDPAAVLEKGVTVGPYALIEADTVIKAGSVVGAHAVVGSYTTVGRDCRIYPHAVIGMQPQDLKFSGEETFLEIGDGSIIREFVTLNRGTAGGGGKTVVGEKNFIMAYVHLAHDCHLGKNVIIANASNLAGHVEVDDYAIIGGLTAIHQFVKIGAYAMVGGASAIGQDVVPYGMFSGRRKGMQGLNLIGLQRHNFSQEEISSLKKAYKLIFSSNLNTTQAVTEVERHCQGSPAVERLLAFIKKSERGISK